MSCSLTNLIISFVVLVTIVASDRAYPVTLVLATVLRLPSPRIVSSLRENGNRLMCSLFKFKERSSY